MPKIWIGNKVQQTNYFELNYVFTLDVPTNQMEKTTSASTVDVSGVLSCNDNIDIKDIQEKLIILFNEEQDKLNKDTKLSYYGMIWDGREWIDGGKL